MDAKGKESQLEFMQLVDLCVKKSRAISQLMGNLESALEGAQPAGHNESPLRHSGCNDILNTLISTWDQWAWV